MFRPQVSGNDFPPRALSSLGPLGMLQEGIWLQSAYFLNWCSTPSKVTSPSTPLTLFCDCFQLHSFRPGVSNSHVRMWELYHKEGWAPKNWCFPNCDIGKDFWESLGLQGDATILKGTNLVYSLEGLMLKLKLQYFGHLILRADSLEKTLMLGRLRARGEGSNRGWDGWPSSPTQ